MDDGLFVDYGLPHGRYHLRQGCENLGDGDCDLEQ